MDLNQIKFHFDVGGETCKSFFVFISENPLCGFSQRGRAVEKFMNLISFNKLLDSLPRQALLH